MASTARKSAVHPTGAGCEDRELCSSGSRSYTPPRVELGGGAAAAPDGDGEGCLPKTQRLSEVRSGSEISMTNLLRGISW